MSTLGKTVALLIIAGFIMSSLLTVNAADYSNPPLTKPSVPEFSVKLVAYPYDIAPVTTTTTTINEYTGKETTTTTTTPGFHVENKSIVITIKNLQFTPYTVTYTNDWPVEEDSAYIPSNSVEQANLYYIVYVKGHYGNSWKMVYDPLYGSADYPTIAANLGSEYTVYSYEPDYDVGSLVDFKVQAVVGYSVPIYRFILVEGGKFIGEHSDWASTQTLTITDDAATAVPQETTITPTPTAQSNAQNPATETTQTPTSTPTQLIAQAGSIPDLDTTKIVIAIIGTVIGVLLVAVVFYKRKACNAKSEVLG